MTLSRRRPPQPLPQIPWPDVPEGTTTALVESLSSVDLVEVEYTAIGSGGKLAITGRAIAFVGLNREENVNEGGVELAAPDDFVVARKVGGHWVYHRTLKTLQEAIQEALKVSGNTASGG